MGKGNVTRAALALSAVTLLGAGCNFGQKATINVNDQAQVEADNQAAMEQKNTPVLVSGAVAKIVMKGGQLMVMLRDGSSLVMEQAALLPDGTTVMLDGKVRLSDGREVMLKENESVDVMGRVMMEVDVTAMEKIMMKDGKMTVMMKDGTSVMMDKDMTLSNGVMVKMNGEVQSSSGLQMMKEGSVLDLMGNVMMGTTGTMKTGDSAMMKSDTKATAAGSYGTYDAAKLAMATTGKVVLFFHAPWCPICVAIEKDVTANIGKIPNGVHILKVDYDTATELKKKYGVTYQHTFVQVDASGKMLKKWSNSTALADIATQVQ